MSVNVLTRTISPLRIICGVVSNPCTSIYILSMRVCNVNCQACDACTTNINYWLVWGLLRLAPINKVYALIKVHISHLPELIRYTH